jgi:hypothetical protein
MSGGVFSATTCLGLLWDSSLWIDWLISAGVLLAVYAVFYGLWFMNWSINKDYPGIGGVTLGNQITLFETPPRYIWGRKERYILLRERLAVLELEQREENPIYQPDYNLKYHSNNPCSESGWWRQIINEATDDYHAHRNAVKLINRSLKRNR